MSFVILTGQITKCIIWKNVKMAGARFDSSKISTVSHSVFGLTERTQSGWLCLDTVCLKLAQILRPLYIPQEIPILVTTKLSHAKHSVMYANTSTT